MSAAFDTVLVEGADAASYLQGQLSQDVESLAVAEEAWSYVLAPNGHIDGFVLVRRSGDESFDLEIDPGFGEQLEARLRRFLLRTKATIAHVPASIADRDDASEVERIRAGRPAMGKDIDERSVPAELGWLDRAVSFTKGCYVGQELVARMDSRVAEPPRRLVRLAVDGDAAPGAEVVVDDVVVGAVTSAAPVDGGVVTLAYVKRGTDLAGKATVAGSTAHIEGLADA